MREERDNCKRRYNEWGEPDTQKESHILRQRTRADIEGDTEMGADGINRAYEVSVARGRPALRKQGLLRNEQDKSSLATAQSCLPQQYN